MNFDRVVALLKGIDADLVCLQEVKIESTLHYTVPTLARALSCDYVLSEAGTPLPGILARQCDVVMAKKPLNLREGLDIKLVVKKKQERTLAAGTVTLNGTDVRVYCTHLDVGNESVRMQQLEQILTHIDQEVPHVLLGDFNALSRADYTDQQWEAIVSERAKNRWEPAKTAVYDKLMGLGYRDAFPGRDKVAPNQLSTVWANIRIDWILLSRSNPAQITHYEVLSSDASDHFPVLIKFRIPAH
uniref:Endonuclease/exonuclease/phosphatase domain-containing protein n=1 Tax=Arcella intermedia TaxID=1963864 RepID=A0A6B2LFH2_9EUKA